MIVLDVTIVGVALPSIKRDLGFSQSAWVVNGYLLTYGGCLLLGGRLGDLFGHRRLFLIGLAVLASISSSRAAHLGGTTAGLTSGYHYAFVGGAICAVLAATLGGAVLRDAHRGPAHERAPEAGPAFDVE